jgi:hypothetical protein
MTPLELLARLSSIIPPPRFPLLRYVGVLAPRSRWRRELAPRPREPEPCAQKGGPGTTRPRSPPKQPRGERARSGDGADSRPSAKIAATIPAERPTIATSSVPPTSSPEPATPHGAAATALAPNIVSVNHWQRLLGGALYAAAPRLDWATLLRRCFETDVLACSSCGGRLRVLGEITEPGAVRLVLESLGMATDAPEPARARDPTDMFDDATG